MTMVSRVAIVERIPFYRVQLYLNILFWPLSISEIDSTTGFNELLAAVCSFLPSDHLCTPQLLFYSRGYGHFFSGTSFPMDVDELIIGCLNPAGGSAGDIKVN